MLLVGFLSPPFQAFLLKLQVYKSTADYETCVTHLL